VNPGRRSGARGLVLLGAPVLIALLLAGCGDGDGQSTLSGHSRQSKDIAALWWAMLGIAAVVFGGAVVMLWIGYARRRRRGVPIIGEDEPAIQKLVVVFGVAIPIVVLVGLFVIANFAVISVTRAPAKGSTAMTIEVVGHQWFWEVRYPGARPQAVTANEIHIPDRTRVNLVATTADVIHSFWVPELNRKIDMIPDRANRILLYADRDGTFRGQCAEFCGLQHAHMAMKVVAEPRARFDAWLKQQAAPRRAPTTPAAQRGEQVFLANACASCHQIRGTSARGQIGPDLTHLASRSTLAALTIPNTRTELTRWIRDPQHVKPGNKMPALRLSDKDYNSLVAYLESLR
jgi:cytochrome c oxidase subunit II